MSCQTNHLHILHTLCLLSLSLSLSRPPVSHQDRLLCSLTSGALEECVLAGGLPAEEGGQQQGQQRLPPRPVPASPPHLSSPLWRTPPPPPPPATLLLPLLRRRNLCREAGHHLRRERERKGDLGRVTRPIHARVASVHEAEKYGPADLMRGPLLCRCFFPALVMKVASRECSRPDQHRARKGGISHRPRTMRPTMLSLRGTSKFLRAVC